MSRTGRSVFFIALVVLGLWLCGAARKARAQGIVDVGATSVNAGSTGDLRIHLLSFFGAQQNAVGLQLDLAYDGQNAPIAANAQGMPDCSVNPALGKDDTEFNFLPNGCAGSACTHIRVILMGMDDMTPLPVDTEMFRCRVSVPPSTPPGNYMVTITESHACDVDSVEVPVLVADGFVAVPSPTGC